MRTRGPRHIDRLIDAIFKVLEDPNQTPEMRMDAAKMLLTALDKRTPKRKKKSPEVRAVEAMIGAPKTNPLAEHLARQSGKPTST